MLFSLIIGLFFYHHNIFVCSVAVAVCSVAVAVCSVAVAVCSVAVAVCSVAVAVNYNKQIIIFILYSATSNVLQDCFLWGLCSDTFR